MSSPSDTRIPHDGDVPLLSFYDRFMKLLGADEARRALVQSAAIGPGARILDVGCGTGTLLATILRARRDAELAGIDPDPKALAHARRKAQRAGGAVRLDRGEATKLPYPDGAFDRVFSSLVLHYLPTGDKKRALREIARVLAPDGSLHLLDYAGLSAGRGLVPRLFRFEPLLADNDEARVLELMREAGLREPHVVERRKARLGPLVLYEAKAPARGA
jgi:SAM-dependent methyltransferase